MLFNSLGFLLQIREMLFELSDFSFFGQIFR
jgi:hypothetical protein